MNKTRFTKLNISALISACFYVLEYFGLGAVIFANMWNTSPALPVVFGLIAFVPLTAELLNAFLYKKRWVDIAVICVSAAFAAGYFLFFAHVVSKLVYFFIAGKPYFITAAVAAVLAFFIFLFPRLNKKAKQISAVTLSVIFAVISLFCIFNLTPFYLSSGAAVFAVEDEYQIAFSTSHSSTGAVEVNGKIYYDETNGENNIRPLHKISVPSGELDAAKRYSIITRSVAVNRAYLPSKGITIKREYLFRPTDDSDGLQIYNLSDTHDVIKGPSNAASYFGDKLDLLILNGDIISDVSSSYQISLIYKLAHAVTGGARPVVFTRGNHECNGALAADLGKYVGCADRGFYYTLKTGPLCLLVLDTNNDMSDDNGLISPVANYDQVRARQSEWLESLGDWGKEAEYRLIISHMAYPLSGYVSESCHWHEWARELVALTRGKAQLAVCGHSHKTVFEKIGTSDNALADYPVLRGSIRSDKYADRPGVSPFEFTGTAIELKDGKINMKFTNSKNRVLDEYITEINND